MTELIWPKFGEHDRKIDNDKHIFFGHVFFKKIIPKYKIIH